MSLLVVATFKSNKTQSEVLEWIKTVAPSDEMVVAPSFPHLHLFKDQGFKLASQDVSPYPPGSYTGAVNSVQLKELGVDYCIVGHSERRKYFHETSTDVASKVRELVAAGITPIVCLDMGDIAPQFASLEEEYYSKCIYCFEPSGGIGGSKTASADDIQIMREQISQFVPNAQFMYGGSVTQENVGSLLPLNLYGFLISSASLDPHHYLSIIEKVSHGA